MKKIVNLRLPVLYALSFAGGIIFAVTLAFFSLDGIYILVPALLMFIACIIYAISRRRAFRAFACIMAAVVFTVGAIYTYVVYFSFCQNSFLVGELVQICGRVREAGLTSTGSRYIILDNVTVGNTRVSGRILAYLSSNAGEYCRRGYEVTFETTISKVNFISDGAIDYRAVKNIKYYCSVTGGLQATYRFSLFGEIANAMENALFNNLSAETAGVSFAMLTGNTDGISAGTLASFRNGGIAHVFAVSGLHIGVIYGALSFIFKKLRLNRFVSATVKIALVAAYAGVCGFSPSSVRALVCCAVSAASSCLYRKYDALNAVAIAALLLLLINPLYMFDTGFVLSFGAMTGIVLLSVNVKRLLSFLPRKLAEALSVGWSAQFATVPALISSFGYVSAAGLFLNIIFIPLVSAVYVIVFVGTLIGAVFPAFASTVLPVLCTPLELIINVVAFCGFENSLISLNTDNLIYLPFIVFTAGMTDKLNLRLSARGALLALPVLCLSIALASTSVKTSANVTFGNGAVTVESSGGSLLIVTENYGGYETFDGRNFDALVVLGGEDNISVVSSLDCSFGALYVRGSAIHIPTLGSTPIIYSDSFEACGVSFAYSGDVLTFNVEGVSVAVERESRGEEYGSLLQDAQFNLYCYGADGAVLFTRGESYGIATCGSMRFIFGGGKVLPSHIVPAE